MSEDNKLGGGAVLIAKGFYTPPEGGEPIPFEHKFVTTSSPDELEALGIHKEQE
jgi:hypothetical protein